MYSSISLPQLPQTEFQWHLWHLWHLFPNIPSFVLPAEEEHAADWPFGSVGGFFCFARSFRREPAGGNQLFPHLLQGFVDRPAHGGFAGDLMVGSDLIQRKRTAAMYGSVFQLV